MSPEMTSTSPPECVVSFNELLKDKRTTSRSATILVQADGQFGGKTNISAFNTFTEIVKNFQSRWWPDPLADYQPSAVMTYAAMAFETPPSDIVEKYKTAEKITGDSEAASNLVALAVAHEVDLVEICDLALEIYKGKKDHPYHRKGLRFIGPNGDPPTAVMLTSAEMMSSREHVVAVLDRLYMLKNWDSDACPAMLSQVVIAPKGDLEANFEKVKTLLEVVSTKEYKKSLGIEGDINTSLIIMSCIIGGLSPETYTMNFKSLTSSGCKSSDAVRLSFGQAAESKGVIATCSVSDDFYMMGKIPVTYENCTALILKYPTSNL